jgi:hypothetical protein
MTKQDKTKTNFNTTKELELLEKGNRLNFGEQWLGLLYSIWLACLPCYLYWHLKGMSPTQLSYISPLFMRWLNKVAPNTTMLRWLSLPIYPIHGILFLFTTLFSSSLLFLAFRGIFARNFGKMERYRMEIGTDTSFSESSKKSPNIVSSVSRIASRIAAHKLSLFWLGLSYSLMFLACYGIIFVHLPPSL